MKTHKHQNKWLKNKWESQDFILDLFPDVDFENGYKKYFNDDFSVLSLSYNNLSTIPDSIGNLYNLKILFLYYNNLSTIPDTIGNLSNLEILYLSNNNLSTMPDSIGNLSNLKRLYLDNNNLSTIPDSIGNLSNLEYLSLDGNNFSKQEQDKIRLLLPNTKVYL